MDLLVRNELARCPISPPRRPSRMPLPMQWGRGFMTSRPIASGFTWRLKNDLRKEPEGSMPSYGRHKNGESHTPALIAAMSVVPAKAGIQKNIGFPRIKYGAGSVRPGMTNCLRLIRSCVATHEWRDSQVSQERAPSRNGLNHSPHARPQH
jgi:hypothetical protein